MLLWVRVIPRSKKVEVKILKDNSLKVRVVSPPIDNRANEELRKVIAEYYNKKESAVRIIKGLRSQNKLVEIKD
jgi:uncharacterized protein (TIGR00251 family)